MTQYTTTTSSWAPIPRGQIEHAISSGVPGFDPKRKKKLTEADDLDKAADDIQANNRNEVSWSLCFLPSFIASLFRSGFLPIACNIASADDPLWVLLPKLHEQRCICRFEEVHVSKKTRKQASKYTLTFDKDIDQVFRKIESQHSECWLYPPLKAALADLQSIGGVARVVSVELWDNKTGVLAAGELGVIVGSVFTSLTGFCDKARFSGSGTVQLAALAGILNTSGFTIWDLGMSLDYKTELGGRVLPRPDFIKMFREARTNKPTLLCEKVNARVAIDSLLATR